MYFLLKVKHSGTEIKRESVLYTTSNARGFALIKMLLKKIFLSYMVASVIQVSGKNAFSAMKNYNPQAHKV